MGIMNDNNLRLKYTLFLCPATVLMLLCQHYFSIQCEIQGTLNEYIPTVRIPLTIIRLCILLGLVVLICITLGINLIRPLMSTSFMLAVTLAPIASIALIASNSLSANSNHVTYEATGLKVLRSSPVQLSESEYDNILLKETRQESVAFQMLEQKRRLRSLYQKLQTNLQCCGLTNFSDCTGISPPVKLLKHSPAPAVDAITSGVEFTWTFPHFPKNFPRSPSLAVRHSVDFKEERCKIPCLKISVSCIDEIKTGVEYCGEAITSVLIAYFAVFVYTLVICWCYKKQSANNVTSFEFTNVLPPVLPVFPTVSPLPLPTIKF